VKRRDASRALIADQVGDFARPFCDQDPEDSKLWDNHVRLVRRFALQLADIEGADPLVCEIAAMLHDIGKDRGRKGHHVRSHALARPFVAKLPIAESQKALILQCILKHRSSFSGEDNEIEVRVLQSADALGVFFDENWQAYSREVLQKDDLMDLYDQTFIKINLASARDIAEPQIDRLKSLLQDPAAPGGGT
jgi:HD superfamily phosphodiesterase